LRRPGDRAGRRKIEDEAAVAVWLASGLAAETFQLDFVRAGSGLLPLPARPQ
jgi:small ligand-binding sensory domain FIST